MLVWLPPTVAVFMGFGSTPPLDAFTFEPTKVELRHQDGRALGDGPFFPNSLLEPGGSVERQLVILNSGGRASLTLGALPEGNRPGQLWEELQITVRDPTTGTVAYDGALVGLASAPKIALPEGETHLALAVGFSASSQPPPSKQGVTFTFTVSSE